MKIAINALHFQPGLTGGAETYLLELLRAFSSLQTSHEFTTLVWPDAVGAIKPFCNQWLDLIVVEGDIFARIRRLAFRLFRTSHPTAWLADADIDLIHYPNAVIRIRPFRIASPIVLTMTDIQHIYHPEYWPSNDIAFRRRYFPKSIKHADHIIAISEFTREGLIEHFNCPPEKVSAIHLGVNHNLLSMEIPRNHLEQFRERYNLPRKFLFFPAGTWPHKNHQRLIRAVNNLVRRGNRDLFVVFTGIRQFSHENVMQLISELGLERHIVHLGHLPFRDIVMLYQTAHGMIFPSLFEGFGLPLVEAMATGCPIACSDRAAIPEIAGHAGYYFNPESIENITEAIENLWFDDELRASLISKGKERSHEFNWQNCAERTIRVYESIVQNR